MSEMGKAMMGTGEASGDNRAIEAAEQAIANPLLDGVSMRGAKGVIISITGGEDMRLMEVDEAANHIKELVDPDANIIWGSAFNNDLEGKIRVSVVATGIDVEEATQAAPLQAKVFAFPAQRGSDVRAETPEPMPAAEPAEPEALAAPSMPTPARAGPEPLTLTPPDGMVEPTAEPERVSFIDEATEAPSELSLGHPDDDEDELLLDAPELMGNEPPMAEPDAPSGGRRSWLTHDEEPAPEPAPRAGSGTLFERMSNIARGAAKAQVEEDGEPAPRMRAARDPLDIPRFLNRQNNQ
jgi:cell division protein FtsZ